MASERSATGKPEGRVLLEIAAIVVIMAVLVLLIMPLARDFVREARQQQAADQCGAAIIAAQTIASEAYGLGATTTALSDGQSLRFERDYLCSGVAISRAGDAPQPFCDAIEYLADAGGSVRSVTVNQRGVVTNMYFISNKGQQVWYIEGRYSFDQPLLNGNEE